MASLGRAENGGRRPPRIDAESRAARAVLPPRGSWTSSAEFIQLMRAAVDLDSTDAQITSAGAVELIGDSYRTPDGTELPLLIARCEPTSRRRPTLILLHGGGLVSGTARTGMAEVVALASAVDGQVISVDYRLAPEHPDPIPVEDCYAAVCQILERADEWEIDATRVVLVGPSAGGCLAAGALLAARDRSGPTVAGAMLLNPMLDDRNDSGSSHQMRDVDPWDRDANATAWAALLGDRAGGDEVSEYSVPARSADLGDLPPLYIDVGSVETLRDEAVDFAARIWADGGNCELHVWPGGYHGYEFVAPQSRLSQDTWASRMSWLRRIVAE